MNKTQNKKLSPIAKVLRKNMTNEEKHLWYDFLRNLSVGFKRQKVINNYVVDFYCPKEKLIIELDGSQHYSEEGKEKDKERDNELKGLGYRVKRYTNLEINTQFEAVCRDILKNIKSKESSFTD